MDLLHLEHFLAVAEEGSFTRAAERVYRTQPAVSQRIKKLEDDVGMPLFTRDMPELTLTAAGNALVDYARRMLKLRDDAMRQMGELHNLSTGQLTIAAYESAAVYLLPGPLRRYFRQFPGIKVGIYRSRLEDIPRQVMDREIDVGFVKDEPVFHGLKSVTVYSDDMILIASPRHPLVLRKRVKVRDLGSEPFVLHHLCSSTEQKVLRLFEAHGTRCHIAAELWSFENVKQFVQQEIGLAIVPRVTVLQELAAGTLVEHSRRGDGHVAPDADGVSRSRLRLRFGTTIHRPGQAVQLEQLAGATGRFDGAAGAGDENSSLAQRTTMFTGVIPILATPFNDDESLDLASWRRLLEFTVGLGVDGVTILGVLGESNRLNDEERQTLIEAAVAVIGKRVPIIVGTSATGTRTAQHLSRMAQNLGADAVMVTPAKEAVPSEDRILELYQRISRAAFDSHRLAGSPSVDRCPYVGRA